MMELLNYQESLKSLMVQDFQSYLTTSGNNNFLFSSPTGSGKTIVAGSVVKELLRDNKNIFVWISIGMGSNAEQSYKKFISTLDFDTDDIYLFDNLYPIPEDKRVIFASWTYLKTKSFDREKDLKISNYQNSFKEKDGSFIKYFQELRKQGKRIILITDEAHHTADSELSKDIIVELNPTIYLEITATPHDKKQYSKIYKPNPKDVENSGIIKNLISISPYETNSNVVDEEAFILSNAEQMRLKIIEEYRKIEPDNIVQPLVLVQCQNSKSGHFKNKIRELGINEIDIAFNFDKDKHNYDSEIFDLNSNIKYLLCNQAIATGWDCPRAHILVQFIRVGSENFQIQVVGRITRTANHKLYNNSIIDTGYVYTYFADNKRYMDEYEKNNEMNIPIRCVHKVVDVNNLTLLNKALSEYGIRKQVITTEELKNLVVDIDRVRVLQKDFVNFVNQRKNILSSSVSYANYRKPIVNHNLGTIYDSQSENTVYLKISFDMYIREMITKYAISRTIYDSLIIYYKEIEKITNDDMPEGIFTLAKEFDLLHTKKESLTLEKVFQLNDVYDISKSAELKFTKNTHGSVDLNGNSSFQQKLSTPEELFIKNYLESNKGNIKCWFKNLDNGDNSLSFVYNINNELHLHTPDFICLDNNSKLKLFEVKDNTLAETTSAINGSKFNALSDLVKENEYKFLYDIIFVDSKQMLQMGHSQNKPI